MSTWDIQLLKPHPFSLVSALLLATCLTCQENEELTHLSRAAHFGERSLLRPGPQTRTRRTRTSF